MYVDRQEEMLNQIQMKYESSPENIIMESLKLYEDVKAGIFAETYVRDKIDTAIKKLNGIIVNFGNEYPRVEMIRDMLMNIKDSLSQPMRQWMSKG